MNDDEKPKIKIIKNGPYVVTGNVPLDKKIVIPDENGLPLKWEEGQKYPDKESYNLCRCGKSKNKPFCDGTHASIDFNGTETADNEKYINDANVISGPDLNLTDNIKFCSGASFCKRAGGTWKLTENSDDKELKELAIEESCNCPSGRLIAWSKDMKIQFENDSTKSISLEENLIKKVSGPICVKGGIKIEGADGIKYEERNRIALCRCGHSCNKPFCDGTHIKEQFNDETNMESDLKNN